jgi:hypothetical protein
MKNDKIYRQVAIEAVKEASIGETEVPRLTRRILDYLERQEPAEPERLACPLVSTIANLSDYHLFTDDELEVHDQQVRQEFVEECCKALSKSKAKREQPVVREYIAGITLLSLDKYRRHWKNIKQINDWWWLRSPGYTTSRAACVRPDDYLIEYGCLVNTIDIAVRPALILCGSHEIGQTIAFGGKTWTTISDSLALADEPLRNMPFRRDWKAADASSYDKSDIRQYLSKWLAEAMEREGK